jgi:hypothetical protein
VSPVPSHKPQPSTASLSAAPRPPIRWWLVGPLGAAMLAVLVRWLSSGGLRHIGSDRHGHRDPHAALESLKQALLLTVTDVARVVALALLAGLLVAAALTAVRLIGRRRWRYRRYAIAPYRTDDATPEQVLALFQDWHQQIHQRLHRRLLFGQPYLALEEHAQPTDGGPEMTMTIVCPEQFVAALDGRLAATYPHSRIGHAFTRRFEPLELDIGWRHAIVRLRKRRRFTATVKTDTREFDQPVIEAELAAMAACGHPMTVQKVLTPIFPAFERVARWLYVRRERKVGRRDAGSPLGAASPLAQAEMRAALDAQNQLLFWFEARVVSRDHAACRMVAGAIAGRRQENTLRQRNTSFTRGLHRRRVALARPEAIPSWRHGVISAAEAATLWQLPSSRIGHIRLARHTIPRAPAPPDIARAPIGAPEQLAEAQAGDVAVAIGGVTPAMPRRNARAPSEAAA